MASNRYFDANGARPDQLTGQPIGQPACQPLEQPGHGFGAGIVVAGQFPLRNIARPAGACLDDGRGQSRLPSRPARAAVIETSRSTLPAPAPAHRSWCDRRAGRRRPAGCGQGPALSASIPSAPVPDDVSAVDSPAAVKKIASSTPDEPPMVLAELNPQCMQKFAAIGERQIVESARSTSARPTPASIRYRRRRTWHQAR